MNEHAGQSYRRGGPGETGAEAATAPGSQGRLSQAERGLTGTAEAVKIATLVVAPLVCALGALGGIGSFATVRHLTVPWFGTWAWIVPVGIDTGILALLAWDLLAEYLSLAWPVLRWTAWTFIAATTYLNIAAAHGNPTASVMHAAMPVLFVTVIEGIRHLIRQITGLATGTRIERIPLSRWLLAPRTTFLLGRRMVLWHVTSYRDGLHLEYQRLLAVSRLQQDYGRWLWRWRAPLRDRLALRLALETTGNTEAATTDTAFPDGKPEPVASLLAQLPRQCLIAPPQTHTAPLSEDDERLVNEAAAIIQDARRQRTRLSQVALARELRTRGHQIANERLRWLTATARNRLPEEQPELPRGSYDGADELMTVEQILKELGGISRRTFYRWRELGRAPLGLKLPNGEIRILAQRIHHLARLAQGASGMKTTDVMIWGVRLKKRKTPTYEIRWKTADQTHSTTRRTKALAESFRSDLLQAAKRGEEFDIESGLPDSLVKTEPDPEPEAAPVRTVLAVAQAYVEMRWPRAAPKTRDGITDSLATVLPALTNDHPDRPGNERLRSALRKYALLPADRRPEATSETSKTMQWLAAATVPMGDLNEAKVIRPALDALTVNLDGTASGANTISRKRAVFYNFLEYAAELGDLAANPIPKVNWTPPKTSQTVDPRVVVNQVQAHNLLVAVTYIGQRGRGRHLSAMLACMYYAALRPGEAIALRKGDCYLPETGWGSITLAKSRPEVNKQWTDSGETHGERGLKHRAAEDVRVIPIPPVLVKILLAHIKEYDVAADGRLFQTERGGPIGSTAYTEVWQEARPLALTPDQVASPMAGRPYDLRHAAVSLWLNGGVSPTEIAKRAGHSVEVLLRVYAKCVHGQEDIANQRIEEILSTATPAPEPVADQAPDNPRPAPTSRRDEPESMRRLLTNARAGASRAQRER